MGTNGNLASGDVLVRHLSNFDAILPEEKAAIDVAVAGIPRSTESRRDLIRQGTPPRGVILILSGWACRYKMLEDGRRQIMSFLIPGDMCDLHNDILGRMDHSIGAITGVRYVELSNAVLHRLSTEHPRIGRALWWQMLVTVATQREWTLNVGQRSADERIGSLFCELLLRLRAVGLARGESADFPLTQTDIADATGLTPVHVNRMVQQMRASGLVSWSGKVLTIPNFTKLQTASLWDPDYLHLGESDQRDERADWAAGDRAEAAK